MKRLLSALLCLMLCATMLLPAGCGADAPSEGCLELTDAPTTTLDNVWYNPGGIFRCAVFDSLLTVEAEMDQITASLAEDYHISEDGTTVTFTLRRGVTWHDGEPFDGEDVLFSLRTVLRSDEVNGVISAAFQRIEGAADYTAGTTETISGVTLSGQTLSFRLSGRASDFLQAIAQFAILPEHLLGDLAPNEIPLEKDFWAYPIGTGCYRIAEAAEGEYFLLERNEDYFGEKAGIRNLRIRLNMTDCVTAMQEGKLDFYVTNDPEEISRLKGILTCSDHRLNILFPAYLVLNLTGESAMSQYLSDVRVRRALLMALDRKAITEAIFPGSEISDTMIPTWDSWYCSMAQNFDFDPEGARALLEEAGFDFSQTLRLRYSTKGQSTADLMNAIAVYWQAIGIRVDLQKFDGSGSDHMFNIRDFDVCYKRFSAFDRASIYEEVHSDGIMQNTLLDLPVYDDLLDELAETTDESARKDIFCRIQQLDQEYLLRLPLFSLANIAYVNDQRFEMPEAYGNLWYRYDLRFSDWRLTA